MIVDFKIHTRELKLGLKLVKFIEGCIRSCTTWNQVFPSLVGELLLAASSSMTCAVPVFNCVFIRMLGNRALLPFQGFENPEFVFETGSRGLTGISLLQADKARAPFLYGP